MASSFSDLGIELMATGENSGTWGDKTNTNLQIVEKSIAGYVEQAVTSGGTTALTITDGDATESTSVARHAVIKLTGTITGNSIVTVPDSIEKVYIVTNGTSGAYTVQFKTASGTGVTFGVSEKTTKLFYSDGTNIVDAGFSGGTDLDGKELILDADADTSITADTDDQIDIKIAGADDFQFTANTFTAQSGSSIVVPEGGLTFGSTAITSTAAELNLLDGVSGLVQADLTKLAAVDSTAAELNIVDGGTSATSTTVADADRVVLNDNGTMVQVAVTDLAAYFDDEITAMPNLTSVGTLTTLTVDSIIINGTNIGHTSDADALAIDSSGNVTASQNLIVTGDLTVSGDDITMGTNTAGNILVADGTNFNSIAAGSLSEISTVANDDVFIAVDTSGGGLKKISRSTIVAGLATSGAISNVVEDTSPQLGGDLDTNSANILIDDAHFIADENGNEQIIFQTTSSAVNQFDVTNAATGNPPSIQATGGDSNIDFNLGAKGTGHVTILGNTNPGTIQFNCENNSHGQQLKPQPHSVGSSAVHTLPNVTAELVPGKTGGTSFANSILVGHETTGTLNNAQGNVGVGITALDALTTADNNVAVGFGALSALASGSQNVAVGQDALTVNNSGSENTALGGRASRLLANGTGNTTVGYNAGTAMNNADADYNILVGHSAGDNITEGAGNVIIGSVDAAAVDGDRTLKIAGYDGSTTTTWISGDNSGNLTFAGDVTVGDDLNLTTDSAVINFGADSDTTLTHTDGTGLTLNSTNKLCFNDATQFIQGASGTVLDIAATDEIELTATLIDVVGNATVSGTLGVTGVLTGTSLDISGNIDIDGTSNLDVVDIDGAVDMASTLGVTGVVTANAGVVVDNITIDGTEIDLSSGDLTIDVAGDITLDAAGDDIKLSSAGTHEGNINLASSNLTFKSIVSDKDMIFQGNDGGSAITALTLDMSAAGAATFNNDVTAFSDKRLKDNVETIPNALDKVCAMRGVNFTRNDNNNQPGTGVIAQEMQEVFPVVVKENNDELNTLSVSYGNLVGVLIEAIKELKEEIEKLKKDS